MGNNNSKQLRWKVCKPYFWNRLKLNLQTKLLLLFKHINIINRQLIIFIFPFLPNSMWQTKRSIESIGLLGNGNEHMFHILWWDLIALKDQLSWLYEIHWRKAETLLQILVLVSLKICSASISAFKQIEILMKLLLMTAWQRTKVMEKLWNG